MILGCGGGTSSSAGTWTPTDGNVIAFDEVFRAVDSVALVPPADDPIGAVSDLLISPTQIIILDELQANIKRNHVSVRRVLGE